MTTTIPNLNGGFRTILQVLITGMIGWLIFTVHTMEVSIRVQQNQISTLQSQVVELRKDINEYRRRENRS